MNLLSPSLKALIRQKIKDAQSFWRGYLFYYPRKQDSEQSSDYCYQWSAINTAIKQRSVEEPTEGWQVNYRTLDVYQPHVKLQQNLSQIPA